MKELRTRFLKSGINNPEKLLLMHLFFLGHLAFAENLNSSAEY
jgi:hypothetical protein